MSNVIPASVVIPVKNEEKNLPSCLERLERFSEIIVVDSGSKDRTTEIAQKHATKLLNFNWSGRYPKKRNWVLLNHNFINEWVLFLDADEFVTNEFCDAIATAIQSDEHSGYWLNYTNYFLGRELKHGVPQRKLALFRLGSGLYERIDESSWSKLDMEIHEHPIITGSVSEIRERIDHRDFRGIARFIDRHKDYAAWEANRIILLDEQPEQWSQLTKRQRFKYRNIRHWWYPWFYFVYTYAFKMGFLDGSPGFYYAFYKAWYFLSIRLLVAERQQPRASPRPIIKTWTPRLNASKRA